ncbi:SubName: Full=Uncharacterized protein {ECO:0000313/EMBL:CCA67337.1} [Serendipita indica DSM 11827]|uniref:PNPLA domain-containing protein n=1 Tax=Serendipita indica (strain DSM 11827) TaxID=1109443 RepID=G4T7Q2_SERID|nr:SubName: Full=Uncharacterized protein {ECO:0000313/EMBL:CCA67337.1} [Serendipita indica DSM 11827]CCA67337.1 hypothetical protein PIIN_01168 [Serendipita indica DSM 11827]
MSNPIHNREIKVLSLDGDGSTGGARALAQIGILRELIKVVYEIQNGRKPSEEELGEIRPHTYFDFVVGTGTGGILALQIGRFRLTLDELERAYNEFAEEVYGRPWGWTFDAWLYSRGMRYDYRRAERVIQEQVTRYLITEENRICNICSCEGKYVDMAETSSRETGKCRVGLTALPADNIQTPRILRSYQTFNSLDHPLKIWEAARATTASFGKLPVIRTGGGRFFSAESGFNNPSRLALEELPSAFNHNRLKCLISIGCGEAPSNVLAKPGFQTAQRSILQHFKGETPEVLNALSNMALDTEHVHQRLVTDVILAQKYFRFNMRQSTKLYTLGTWNQQNKKVVEEILNEYLEEGEIVGALENAARFII